MDKEGCAEDFRNNGLKIYTETQKRLLALMSSFDDACRSNGIKYSLACGTALGGVRENGFIMWDNDIDIMMRFQDYQIMNEIFQMHSHSFCWVTSESEELSPVILARVYESNVCFDELEAFPYIDIHIYVGATNNDKNLLNAIVKTDFLTKVYWVKQRRYHSIFKRKKSLVGSLCKIPLVFISKNYCINQIKAYTTRWDYETSDRVFPIQGYYKMKEVIPKDWMEQYEDILFSGRYFMIIKEYDAYLTQLYGDYMVPKKYR